MTDAQKEQVRYLRCEGLGYGAIATRLGISENTVKSFCRRNNLTGVASKEPVVVCRNAAGRFLNTPRENRENFAPRLAAAHGGSCTRSLSISRLLSGYLRPLRAGISELWEPETEVLFPRLLHSGAVPERRHP